VRSRPARAAPPDDDDPAAGDRPPRGRARLGHRRPLLARRGQVAGRASGTDRGGRAPRLWSGSTGPVRHGVDPPHLRPLGGGRRGRDPPDEAGRPRGRATAVRAAAAVARPLRPALLAAATFWLPPLPGSAGFSPGGRGPTGGSARTAGTASAGRRSRYGGRSAGVRGRPRPAPAARPARRGQQLELDEAITVVSQWPAPAAWASRPGTPSARPPTVPRRCRRATARTSASDNPHRTTTRLAAPGRRPITQPRLVSRWPSIFRPRTGGRLRWPADSQFPGRCRPVEAAEVVQDEGDAVLDGQAVDFLTDDAGDLVAVAGTAGRAVLAGGHQPSRRCRRVGSVETSTAARRATCLSHGPARESSARRNRPARARNTACAAPRRPPGGRSLPADLRTIPPYRGRSPRRSACSPAVDDPGQQVVRAAPSGGGRGAGARSRAVGLGGRGDSVKVGGVSVSSFRSPGGPRRQVFYHEGAGCAVSRDGTAKLISEKTGKEGGWGMG